MINKERYNYRWEILVSDGVFNESKSYSNFYSSIDAMEAYNKLSKEYAYVRLIQYYYVKEILVQNFGSEE